MRKAAFFILTMFVALGAMAQTAEPAQKTFWDDPVNDPLLPVYLLTAFVFIVIEKRNFSCYRSSHLQQYRCYLLAFRTM
jgi:hypothetical protein